MHYQFQQEPFLGEDVKWMIWYLSLFCILRLHDKWKSWQNITRKKMEMKLEKLLVCIYVYIYQCFTVTIVIYVIYKFALSLIKYQRHLKKNSIYAENILLYKGLILCKKKITWWDSPSFILQIKKKLVMFLFIHIPVHVRKKGPVSVPTFHPTLYLLKKNPDLSISLSTMKKGHQ